MDSLGDGFSSSLGSPSQCNNELAKRIHELENFVRAQRIISAETIPKLRARLSSSQASLSSQGAELHHNVISFVIGSISIAMPKGAATVSQGSPHLTIQLLKGQGSANEAESLIEELSFSEFLLFPREDDLVASGHLDRTICFREEEDDAQHMKLAISLKYGNKCWKGKVTIFCTPTICEREIILHRVGGLVMDNVHVNISSKLFKLQYSTKVWNRDMEDSYLANEANENKSSHNPWIYPDIDSDSLANDCIDSFSRKSHNFIHEIVVAADENSSRTNTKTATTPNIVKGAGDIKAEVPTNASAATAPATAEQGKDLLSGAKRQGGDVDDSLRKEQPLEEEASNQSKDTAGGVQQINPGREEAYEEVNREGGSESERKEAPKVSSHSIEEDSKPTSPVSKEEAGMSEDPKDPQGEVAKRTEQQEELLKSVNEERLPSSGQSGEVEEKEKSDESDTVSALLKEREKDVALKTIKEVENEDGEESNVYPETIQEESLENAKEKEERELDPVDDIEEILARAKKIFAIASETAQIDIRKKENVIPTASPKKSPQKKHLLPMKNIPKEVLMTPTEYLSSYLEKKKWTKKKNTTFYFPLSPHLFSHTLTSTHFTPILQLTLLLQQHIIQQEGIPIFGVVPIGEEANFHWIDTILLSLSPKQSFFLLYDSSDKKTIPAKIKQWEQQFPSGFFIDAKVSFSSPILTSSAILRLMTTSASRIYPSFLFCYDSWTQQFVQEIAQRTNAYKTKIYYFEESASPFAVTPVGTSGRFVIHWNPSSPLGDLLYALSFHIHSLH